MVAVDDSKLDNGCAQVAPATWARKEGWLPKAVTGKDGSHGDADFDHMGPYVPVEMEAGDLLIYDNYMCVTKRFAAPCEYPRALSRCFLLLSLCVYACVRSGAR